MKIRTRPSLFHRPMLYKFSVVLVIGFILFIIGGKEMGKGTVPEAILLGYSLIKTFYFFKLVINRIKQTAHQVLDTNDIMSFIGINTILIVVSYAVDYICLFEINTHSFSGIQTWGHLGPHFVTFLYFSIVTFSTAGVGDIAPITLTARLLTSAELMLAWFLTILVIANFSFIRESFVQKEEESIESENKGDTGG